MNEFDISPNAKALQRAAVLDALRVKPTGTIEFREVYGICHSAGRVLELRKAGYPIVTINQTVTDAAGRPHRSAVYCLKVQP